jgi:hypothetical protein
VAAGSGGYQSVDDGYRATGFLRLGVPFTPDAAGFRSIESNWSL